MAKSTNLIGDMKTVITTGPSATVLTKSIAPAGPIMDYPGNNKLALLELQEAAVLVAGVVTDTDAADPNLALLQGVAGALLGTAGPSAQLLTDLGTVITVGPTALTKAKASVPAGPIMDYLGNVRLVRGKLAETSTALTPIIANSAADAANLALLQGVQQALV